MLALLVDPDKEVKAACLETIKLLREALYKIELAAQHDDFFQGYLRDMVWPCNVWAREVLVACGEAGDKECPEDIKADIMALLNGLKGSVICENAFRKLSDATFQHRSGKLGRVSRWHRLLASDLLEDHDLKQPP